MMTYDGDCVCRFDIVLTNGDGCAYSILWYSGYWQKRLAVVCCKWQLIIDSRMILITNDDGE